MNQFPKQIIIDYDLTIPFYEIIEIAIDEALEIYSNSYNFQLQSDGVSLGIGNMNYAWFNVQYKQQLDVRKLVYG